MTQRHVRPDADGRQVKCQLASLPLRSDFLPLHLLPRHIFTSKAIEQFRQVSGDFKSLFPDFHTFESYLPARVHAPSIELRH